MKDFNACFSSKAVAEHVIRGYRESDSFGIGSTPTVFFNGKLLEEKSIRPEILDGLVQYCIKRSK